MALSDSKKAIGAVSALLQTRLLMNTGSTSVNIGRPESVTGTGSKLNIFLYQIDIDGYMQTYALDAGQKPPLWLSLSYLLTAYDSSNNSDNEDAHNLLGEAMLALQEMNFIDPVSVSLSNNPESLKVTLDSANSDLLSKIMQGSDEKYRVSTAFQVRPVMIAPSEEPSYTLPVETIGPPDQPGVQVYPSLGPRIESLEPDKFSVGDTITITGRDIGNSTEEIIIGDQRLPAIAANTGFIKVDIPDDISISAGSHTIRAVMKLNVDQELISNAVLGHFLPTLNTVVTGGLINDAGNVWGTMTLTGKYLGNADDDIYVNFYASGNVALMLQITGTANQTLLTVNVTEEDAIPGGDYYIILRVNGVQALNAPLVDWS